MQPYRSLRCSYTSLADVCKGLYHLQRLKPTVGHNVTHGGAGKSGALLGCYTMTWTGNTPHLPTNETDSVDYVDCYLSVTISVLLIFPVSMFCSLLGEIMVRYLAPSSSKRDLFASLGLVVGNDACEAMYEKMHVRRRFVNARNMWLTLVGGGKRRETEID